MVWSRTRKLIVAALGVAAIIICTAAVAVGTTPSQRSSGLVYTCYKKSNGSLRLVRYPRRCHKREKLFTWNVRAGNGPKGADGKPGANGQPGTAGQNGGMLLSGPGTPTSALGIDGDFYVDTDNADLYGPKAGGAWPGSSTALRGPAGAKGADGKDGSNGTDGTNGTNGEDGSDGQNGAVGPPGPIGQEGSVGAPGAPGSDGTNGTNGTNGTDGRTVLNGAGAPDAALGAAGDFYLDTTATALYGPKTTEWPATGISLKGAKGDKGDQGVPGAKGEQGAAGAAGSGAILAANSGVPAQMLTTLGGVANTVAVLPLSGTGVQNTQLLGGTLDETGIQGAQTMLQVFPRDTTLTSISARFSNNLPLSLIGTTLTLQAQLYTSSDGDNVLTPVPGATCEMSPPFTGLVTIGAVSSCITTGLSIPIPLGASGALVISPISNGIVATTNIFGYVAASIALN